MFSNSLVRKLTSLLLSRTRDTQIQKIVNTVSKNSFYNKYLLKNSFWNFKSMFALMETSQEETDVNLGKFLTTKQSHATGHETFQNGEIFHNHN